MTLRNGQKAIHMQVHSQGLWDLVSLEAEGKRETEALPQYEARISLHATGNRQGAPCPCLPVENRHPE